MISQAIYKSITRNDKNASITENKALEIFMHKPNKGSCNCGYDMGLNILEYLVSEYLQSVEK